MAEQCLRSVEKASPRWLPAWLAASDLRRSIDCAPFTAREDFSGPLNRQWPK